MHLSTLAVPARISESSLRCNLLTTGTDLNKVQKMILKRFIFLLLGVFVLAAACSKTVSIEKHTPSGPVRGYVADGIEIFRGIPYAEPPVGELRWKEPVAVKPWRKVLPCTEHCSACPQPGVSAMEGGEGIGDTSEDCLYLNIWSPAKKPPESLPVMVWIHGGAFMTGAGSQPGYNGAKLAGKGVVVVTLNYRLGPFGFLAHPALSRESSHGTSGNYGLYDQIEALRWVQRNISAFGGDPGRVTLFGESAGAISVAYLLLSPLAKGLFHRAIMQSGAPTSQRYIMPGARGTLDQALETGKRLAAKLGCADEKDPAAAMRAKTTQEIMEIAGQSADFIFRADALVFAPVVDGRLLPSAPEELLEKRRYHHVPVIVGTNRDEASVFARDVSLAGYRSWVKAAFPDRSREIFRTFPANDEEEMTASANRFLTALWFTEPARFIVRSMAAGGTKTYQYYFTHVPKYALTTELGAFHGQEIEFIFGDLGSTVATDEDRALSSAMMDYWTNFARTGDPNREDLIRWPAYDAKAEKYMEFGDAPVIGSNLEKNVCDFLEHLRAHRPHDLRKQSPVSGKKGRFTAPRP